MNSIKPLALAIPALLAGLAMPGISNATSYAVSTNTAANGTVDVFQALPAGGGSSCSLINSGINGVADCPVGTFVSNFSIGPQNTSGAQATLTGTAGAIGSVGPQGGIVDVAPQNLGSATNGNNEFTPNGIQGSNSSRGDSQLISEQEGTLNTTSGNPNDTTTANPGITLTSRIALSNIAESELDTQGQATAQGNVSSGTATAIQLQLADDGQIGFSFDFTPFLEATIAPDSIFPGSTAKAINNVLLTITPQSGGLAVFAWAPDGSGGNINNGTVLADPFSLNLNVEQQILGTNTYNPGTGTFVAVTDTVAAGAYVLTLSTTNRTEIAKATAAVPTPSVVALMGFGLFGMGFMSRRRARKS